MRVISAIAAATTLGWVHASGRDVRHIDAAITLTYTYNPPIALQVDELGGGRYAYRITGPGLFEQGVIEHEPPAVSIAYAGPVTIAVGDVEGLAMTGFGR